MIKNKKVAIVFLVLLMLMAFSSIVCAEEEVAGTIDVGSGLTGTKEALGTNIQDILSGLAYFIGIAGVGALIFCGFKLTVATDDKDRAQVKAHIGWVLGGIALASLSIMIVGYVASLMT